jgi:NADPH-dependent glutamate synthase beta subunit-like oxidoreductase
LGVAKTEFSKEVVDRILDIEKLQHCFDCGICTASCSMAELIKGAFTPRTLLENTVLDPESVLNSEALWLCAWCYRCYKRCPQALKVPEIFLSMRKAAAERGADKPFEKALQTIVENVPLPLVTACVCFHPERAGQDRQKVLEKTENLYVEHLKKEKARRAQEVREGKVAVIGSGPAGLSVAYELSLEGYGVTVFEALPDAGGMLKKCIPEYRLPKIVLAKEIQLMKDLGIEFRTGVKIGENLHFKDLLREGYNAIFVGVGAHRNQKLNIEGVDLKGVVHALEFLWNVNSGEKFEVGKNVAVIGGGNVAVDAARTILRCGTKDVTLLYRRSREEMPAIPWEVKEGENEGMKIEFLVSPKRILGDDGKVVAVECVRTRLDEPDETGRRKAIPIEGSEFKRETDMVILAIGETPDLDFLPKDIELNEDGTIWVDPLTMETSMQGVFAGGDAVTGPATVIEAIRAGKCAATSISNHMKSLGGK